MKYNPGDKVIISATVKVSDDCGDMILVESNSGEFYIEESDIAKGIESNPVYEKGMKDAWEIIRQLENRKFSGMYVSGEDLIKLFGTMYISEIVTSFTPSEVSEKMGEWIKEKSITVGDVVEDTWNKGVVTYIDDDGLRVLRSDGICEIWKQSGVTKTGRRIDLSPWFEKIGGTKNE